MTPIESKHQQLLDEGIDFGAALGPEQVTYDGGSKQEFQFGSIYFHPRIGEAFECHGAILGRYKDMFEELGMLGYPVTDEQDNPRVPGGRTNKFENGSLFLGDAALGPTENGAVLSFSQGAVVPLPQGVADLWTAQEAIGASIGTPSALGYPATSAPGTTVFPFSSGAILLDSAGKASRSDPIPPELGRYFQPADKVENLSSSLAGTRATALLGGDAALKAIAGDLAALSGPTDFAYFLNWHVDIDLALIAGDSGSTLRTLLSNATGAGVQVRAMFWAGTDPGHPPLSIDPSLFIGFEVLRPLVMSHVANRSLNSAAALFINGLTGDASAILDSRHLPFGSHHMKLLVIRSGTSLIAYAGGVEYNADQLQAVDGEPGSPVLDLSVRLEDRAAWLALDTFVKRWQAHPDGTPGLRGAGLPVPPSSGGPLTVQMTHTYGESFPFARPVRSSGAALANGIRNARQFFYLEDEYATGSEELGRAIRDCLGSNPGALGILVIAAEDSSTALPDLPFRRRAFLAPLVNEFPGQFLVFERLGPAGATTGQGAYVHTTLLIADDEAAFIGSAGSTRRSWFHDSELELTVVDTVNGVGAVAPGSRGWARDLRCQSWSRQLGVGDNTLGDPAVDLRVWQGVANGTVTGSFVKPYDTTLSPPRPSNRGLLLNPLLLDRIWDSAVDPG